MLTKKACKKMINISVIIPSYNSAKTIVKTIEAIKKQEGLEKTPEIIIVDDGSLDRTIEVLNKTENIIVISQKNSGPATARNNGAKIANGEILVFTDSDTVPHKDWLKNLTSPFENKNIVATTGTYSIENKGSKLAQLIQEEIEYKHSKYNDFVAFGGSYNLAIRKDLFFDIGGFNEEYKNASGEDVDISYKIINKGYKIKFVKDAIVGHYHPENTIKYLKTQFKHGFWRAKLYFDHPNKVKGDDYTGFKEIFETLFAGFIIISPIVYILEKMFYKNQNKRLCIINRHCEQSLDCVAIHTSYNLIEYLVKYFSLLCKNTHLLKRVFMFPIISLLFIEYNFVSNIYLQRNKNQNNLPSKLYATFIFSLRAIYRTIGFIKGLFHFI